MFRLRVTTYNIHKAKGLDGRVMPARIAEVLRCLNSDVIALQEVMHIGADDTQLNQARFVAEQLGMHYAIGENRRIHGGAYGNVVLSRFPLRNICNYDISIPRRERRGCLRTDIDVPDYGTVHVFNVHLGTAFLERRSQGRRLVEEELLGSRDLSGPRIVLGDFNEWTRGLASQLLFTEFNCADIRLKLRSRATYPGLLPLLHLDHIYFDRALTLEQVGLYRTRLALIASDHLPLWAEFGLASIPSA